jgi:hypothetical protein
VEKAEREAIMRQGVTRPETPQDRRELAGLEEDLLAAPDRGSPVRMRLRNFRPSADAYLAAARGPLAYMVRMHVIEAQVEEHQERLAEAWRAVAAESDGDPERFGARWRETAEAWPFDDVNDLVERHNRWYPAESRLPMDPATGDFALVNGRPYRMAPLDAEWVLERFPPELERAAETQSVVAGAARMAA